MARCSRSAPNCSRGPAFITCRVSSVRLSGRCGTAAQTSPPTDVDKAIARHAVNFVPSGATLQTGIGSIPNQIATLLAEGDRGDYGLHSEMFTDGCMQLHRAGKITNAGKGQYDGVSVTTFAFGSTELYAWLDGNETVAFLPVEIVNAPEVIGANT
jgi:acyl-CoA hydrolase